LVTPHQRTLRGLCERTLGHTGLAEDAAQEAVLQALLGLGSLRHPEQFGAWLLGIGLNICRRWLRARTGEALSWDALLGGRHVHEPLDTLAPDPAWAAEEDEISRQVRQAVHALPPGQRAAVVLFYLAGLSHAETAAALGVPIGAIKTRLHKARASLRRDLWTLWEELHAMPATTPQEAAIEYVDVRVVDVRRVLPEEGRTLTRDVILLQETSGAGRILGIWVGTFESEALLILLSGVEVPRPLTFTFANSVLEAAGGRLREVRITRLAGETFLAETMIQTPDGQERVVDSRPSDALCLALVAQAPIRVAEALMRDIGQAPSQVEADFKADGERVLDRGMIAARMEQNRQRHEAELEEVRTRSREEREARRKAT
jgi:RNA polymerase sigma factor (sigma-70 family)